jgi:hypothetical protein
MFRRLFYRAILLGHGMRAGAFGGVKMGLVGDSARFEC